jgi:Protein of unknown function (DUF2726)
MLETWHWVLAVLALVAAAGWYFQQTQTRSARERQSRRERLDRLDTVADWPPEATRLLGSAGRKAHAALAAALPECGVFAQVPLARFVRVPRRQSYSEWITRVGHVAVDFVICDSNSQALGVVLLQTLTETPRAEKRRDRVARVLKHAGIKLFVWREDAIPSAQAARTMIIQASTLAATDGGAPSSSFENLPSLTGRKLPVPDAAAVDEDPWAKLDRPHEPPPSTWFDDLDSGAVPLDQPRPKSLH